MGISKLVFRPPRVRAREYLGRAESHAPNGGMATNF